MNELIKELYEQAHDVEKKTLYFICPTVPSEIPKQISREDEYKTFNPSKFAELIVKKCLHIVDDEGCGEGGSIRAMEKIKDHFGLEEITECKHEWVSAKNPVVTNGSICTKCFKLDKREPEEL
jgi:hypothetical protein